MLHYEVCCSKGQWKEHVDACSAVREAHKGAKTECSNTEYVVQHYGECCSRGAYKIPGHGPACESARPKVKQEL